MIRTMGIKSNPELVNQLGDIGQIANHVSSMEVFGDYQERKAKHTIRRQASDLKLFAQFLQQADVDIDAERLTTNPEAWRGVTWGLASQFMGWQLTRGYAVSSINVRLSTIKTYAKLALKAGAILPEEYALIQAVEGYSHKEIARVDREREEVNLPTRMGRKKAEAVSLKKSQADKLKMQPNTPQGRRDALLMRLLLDHGLRLGEVAGLEVKCFDLEEGLIRFFRQKVDLVQLHRLTPDTLQAAKNYIENDAPEDGNLWRGSASKQDGKDKFHGGMLTDDGMSTRAITQRVRVLGEAVGIQGLSPHDCRHYWATQAARNKTPIDRLKDAGGWSSPAMPLRYVKAEAIANEGVNLG